MTRTLQEQLIAKGLAKVNRKKALVEKPKQRKGSGFYSEKSIQEERRTREIEELMGTRRPKYYRSKGAYRSR